MFARWRGGQPAALRRAGRKPSHAAHRRRDGILFAEVAFSSSSGPTAA